MKHVCPKCKIPKPINAKYWYRCSSAPSGFGLQRCKACTAAYEKARYVPAQHHPPKDEGPVEAEPARVHTAPKVTFDERAFQEELAAIRVGCDTSSIFRPIEKAIPIS